MRLLSIYFLWILIALSATALSAEEFEIAKLQEQIIETIDKVRPSVVSIGSRGMAFSGVIVSADGHVLTAGHTVRPGSSYRVMLPDGRRFSGRGMGSSSRLDCGLIKIRDASDLPYVEMGDSSKLKRNQPCLSLSFPGGQGVRGQPVVRFGRVIDEYAGRGSMVQTSARMEPGDSGGPLFDLNGQVIGIHSRIGRSMSRNYEIPVNTFKKYWQQLNRAESFGTTRGPGKPKLGFEGEDNSSRDGMTVLSLVRDGAAQKAGLKKDDVVTGIGDQRIGSVREMKRVLEKLSTGRVKQVELKILRDGKPKTLTVLLERTKTVPIPLPATTIKRTPKTIKALADLPAHLSELEKRLDDHCVNVSSRFEDQRVQIVAMYVANSSYLVSKSSMIGQSPYIVNEGKRISLEVLARDTGNDLVLLGSPTLNNNGVDVTKTNNNGTLMGRFLLTPDPDGSGNVSICSSPEFESRKQVSRGYLGVFPSDEEDGGALLDEVHAGAARKAGLKAGDVIVKLNDTKISTSSDLRRFLRNLDPNNTVKAIILRGEEQLEKHITLGAAPANTNHAAELMDKSGRRDGFSRVYSHDADLQPDECGGPIFDLKGNFVGLNIARNSRVRSYTIPRDVIKRFVSQNSKP